MLRACVPEPLDDMPMDDEARSLDRVIRVGSNRQDQTIASPAKLSWW
jgi:hypothetical protein